MGFIKPSASRDAEISATLFTMTTADNTYAKAVNNPGVSRGWYVLISALVLDVYF